MDALLEYKRTNQQTWAKGDYDAMLRQEGLYGVGERLVRRLDVGPGDRVLDVACGTGNAAIPAAAAGATVTGVDLTPSMLDAARQRADAAGVEVDWREADAEDLRFDDDSFDVVLSTFGCMFAPRHEVVATEIARVLGPGGRLGVCSWTPDGSIGDFFRTVGVHLPAMPDFVDPPPAWGDEDHVRELFEGTGIALHFEHEMWEIGHDSVDDAVECYTTAFGPVVEARRLATSQGSWPTLRDDLRALFERHDTADGPQLRFAAPYLTVLGQAT